MRVRPFKLDIYSSGREQEHLPPRLVEFYSVRARAFTDGCFGEFADKYDLYPNTRTFVFYDNDRVLGGLRVVDASDGPLPLSDKFGKVQKLVPNVDLSKVSHCEISGVCAIAVRSRTAEHMGTIMQKAALNYIRHIGRQRLVFEGLRNRNIGPLCHAAQAAQFDAIVIVDKANNLHNIQRVPTILSCKDGAILE